MEGAEHLQVKDLKSLIDFAVHLADHSRGRFFFVYTPTDGLYEIDSFGSLAPAEVIHVGDLNETEAAAFIAGLGCNTDQASALYALVSGHLPHLVKSAVEDYCAGSAALADVEDELLRDIEYQFWVVDLVQGVGSACAGLGNVERRELARSPLAESARQESSRSGGPENKCARELADGASAHGRALLVQQMKS